MSELRKGERELTAFLRQPGFRARFEHILERMRFVPPEDFKDEIWPMLAEYHDTLRIPNDGPLAQELSDRFRAYLLAVDFLLTSGRLPPQTH